jgi:hypothetical protein
MEILPLEVILIHADWMKHFVTMQTCLKATWFLSRPARNLTKQKDKSGSSPFNMYAFDVYEKQ